MSQLSRGCQSPASAFGPAPARTFTLPGGTLFRHMPGSSHRPLLPLTPDPTAPLQQLSAADDPGTCPTELGESRTGESRTVVPGTDGTRARRSKVPAQAAPGTCADSRLLLPALPDVVLHLLPGPLPRSGRVP